MPAIYDTLLVKLVEEARGQDDVLGILLTGSLARGDALPGTDIDLRFILADGISRSSDSAMRDGVLVERGYADLATACANLDARPMNVYAYLDGQILHDPQDVLARLTQQARQRYDTYRTSEQERAQIAFLLGCSRDKISVALKGGDLLKAAFVTGTSSWGIMEGLWAANNRPLPPNSSVRPHLRDLTEGPADIDNLYRQLFLADTSQRVQVALDLIEWILDRLG
ncbi:MAG TPA: nucleotidyltransferase domain-containing protein [Mycobacteriales bacterium]|jgi:hypothetical protein|nr:nucleotidyltransferase domain-containing protein [Mycobacteriales bacterium]